MYYSITSIIIMGIREKDYDYYGIPWTYTLLIKIITKFLIHTEGLDGRYV
jgi:hypothetical protein